MCNDHVTTNNKPQLINDDSKIETHCTTLQSI